MKKQTELKFIRLGIYFFISTLFLYTQSNAQVIDEVVAVVGEEVILRSDVEGQLLNMQFASEDEESKTRCWVLDQLMQKKLMLVRAKYDSLKVTDEQVEAELNQRIQYYLEQFGSEEKMEEVLHKSVLEIKNEFRDNIKDQLLIDQMESKVTGGSEVTPGDIKKFYNRIPEDSLPFIDEQVEVAQIMMYPKLSKEDKEYALNKIQNIRKRIVSGEKSFESLAFIESQDVESAKEKGDLGTHPADVYVPEFAAAALKLKKDSISQVVETKFGFHIIKMIDRKGDLIHVKHILIKPMITDLAKARAKQYLDSLRTRIIIDSISFSKAAVLYSDDELTKNRGGVLTDQKSNSTKISVKDLSPAMADVVDKMKVGEVSSPTKFTTYDGQSTYGLIYLKQRVAPHKANLKEDYNAIKMMAAENLKTTKTEKWVSRNIPITYTMVKPEVLNNCNQTLSRWVKKETN